MLINNYNTLNYNTHINMIHVNIMYLKNIVIKKVLYKILIIDFEFTMLKGSVILKLLLAYLVMLLKFKLKTN